MAFHGFMRVVATVPPGSTREQSDLMLQRLLIERFQLRLHHAPVNMKSYELIFAQNGPKFISAEHKSGTGSFLSLAKDVNADNRTRFSIVGRDRIRIEAQGLTMTALANKLASLMKEPVTDATGLAGYFDIALEFTLLPGSGLDLFSALAELGLRLESRNGPVDTLVVDSVQRIPTGN